VRGQLIIPLLLCVITSATLICPTWAIFPTPSPSPTPPPCYPNPKIPILLGYSIPFRETVQTSANHSTVEIFPGVAAPDTFWKFLPSQSGDYSIKLTGFNTALGIYEGSDCCNVQAIQTLDFSAGGEEVVAALTAGTIYKIVGKGSNPTDFGPMTLEINGPIQPTSNDTCPASTRGGGS